MVGTRATILRAGLIALLLALVAGRLLPGGELPPRRGVPYDRVAGLLASAGYQEVAVARTRWGRVRGSASVRAYDPTCYGNVRVENERLTAFRSPRAAASPGEASLYFYGTMAERTPGFFRVMREVLKVEGRYALRLTKQRPPSRMLVMTGPEPCLVPRIDWSSFWLD